MEDFEKKEKNIDDIFSFVKEHVLKMQEEERERLVRDLHDTTVQDLVYIIHCVEIASKYIDKNPEQAKEELSNIRSLLKDTIKNMRNTIYDLRPMTFDDLGFFQTLQNFLDEIRNRYQIEVNVEIDNRVNSLPDPTLMNLFRIIQEFLINSVKHAKCKKTELHLNFDHKNVHLFLSDDGIGCDLEKLNLDKHYGLDIINNRIMIMNGTRKIVTSPGNGFSMDVLIPIVRVNK